MMHFARLAGLHDQADGSAQALADEVVVHGGGRQQAGDRNAVGANHAVGQHDDVVAAGDRLFGAVAETVEHGLHALGAERGVIGEVERLGVERVLEMADGADFFQIRVGQDRLAHFEALFLRGALVVEDVGARADEGDQAHHQLLADRIDRRIGDLGEVLLEIAEQRLEREDMADIGVSVPMAPIASWPVTAMGAIRNGGVFLRIAEGLLAVEQRHVDRGSSGIRRA